MNVTSLVELKGTLDDISGRYKLKKVRGGYLQTVM
jgi:hypothetical protein